MEQTSQRGTIPKFLVSVVAIIFLSSLASEVLIAVLQSYTGSVPGESFLRTGILFLFAVPALTVALKQGSRAEWRLQRQLEENRLIQKQLMRSNIELEYNAAHDALTGLPNRLKLFSDLELKTSSWKEFSVLSLDLDRFKTINDTMGHLSGDRFIRLVSIRLKQSLPSGTSLYRHGGDEFIVLAELPNGRIEEVTEVILSVFKEPFEVEGTLLYTSASIGISQFPGHGPDAAALIKHADKAMYEAKELGGGRAQLFEHPELDQSEKLMRIESDLRVALDTDQLTLHYQPVIELGTARLEGFEALIRWQHPELGLVSPAEFIPVAERSSLIDDIGMWVLETASRQVAGWHTADPSLRLAVNVSIRQFRNPKFPGVVRNVLQVTQFPPDRLILEITESMMQDDAESRLVIEDLRALGVKFAIDDFGTGYSSLSKLGFLPIDYLKIDRSFTAEMGTHPPMQSIVQTIIDMGRNLDMLLIAEGIEDGLQADLLKKGGCQLGQGYLFSRPAPPETIEQQYGLSPVHLGTYMASSPQKAAADIPS
ncbi:putative bifunctional diguanylate cyclase/phosphodiesterase [Sporosarcina trichiuri]|uniref:putative bifunctional diguanylate cyclase/phosphodiesterase n=1 Tax=Sporosarcina trichiuri TaxID=3056445 RepID=UPI0025B60D78|nr:EAL domain-containing protein [Sporosarcina sp. 0.2-SM1T-5]WJY26274.1 EAL domain-containing protein [Sporosarcina sp. 0.2-SM1T-5]